MQSPLRAGTCVCGPHAALDRCTGEVHFTFFFDFLIFLRCVWLGSARRPSPPRTIHPPSIYLAFVSAQRPMRPRRRCGQSTPRSGFRSHSGNYSTLMVSPRTGRNLFFIASSGAATLPMKRATAGVGPSRSRFSFCPRLRAGASPP